MNHTEQPLTVFCFTEAALPLSCSKINPHTSQINLASLGTSVHKAPRPSKAWTELVNLHTSQVTWCILFIYLDVSSSVYVQRCDATLTKVWRFIVLQCWKASLGVRLPCNCLLLWWTDNNTVCALIVLPSMSLCWDQMPLILLSQHSRASTPLNMAKVECKHSIYVIRLRHSCILAHKQVTFVYRWLKVQHALL